MDGTVKYSATKDHRGFRIDIVERETWPLNGCDSIIALLKEPTPASGIDLMGLAWKLAVRAADNLGTLLHHGEFVVTSDIDTVRSYGTMDEHRDCDECADGVAKAVAYLTVNPLASLLVGHLYWSPRSDRG